MIGTAIAVLFLLAIAAAVFAPLRFVFAMFGGLIALAKPAEPAAEYEVKDVAVKAGRAHVRHVRRRVK